MDPIKLFFAGAVHTDLAKVISKVGVKNRLVTFAYPNELDLWINAVPKKGNIIIDSGAFSAWNRGSEINIGEYIEYCLKSIGNAEKSGKSVRVVNLDVIPGRVGETKSLNALVGKRSQLKKNKKLINDAAKQGLKNLKKMKKAGITPIHVFHQGEDWKWLHKMVELTDYIGISPANDMPNDSKKRWMYSVFEYMYKHNIKVKTHGFAVWVFEIMRDLPWTSCDAATWKLAAGMGNLYIPNGGFDNPNFSLGTKSFFQTKISERMDETAKASKNILQTIESSGYTFEDLQLGENRYALNCKFFLAMEKWLNEYKKKNNYINPSNKLIL